MSPWSQNGTGLVRWICGQNLWSKMMRWIKPIRFLHLKLNTFILTCKGWAVLLLRYYLGSNPYSSILLWNAQAWSSAKHKFLLLPDFLFLSIDTVRGDWRAGGKLLMTSPYSSYSSVFAFPYSTKSNSMGPLFRWYNSAQLPGTPSWETWLHLCLWIPF